MLVPNKKELEKKFPLQMDSVVRDRIQKITIEMEKMGYKRIDDFNDMIRFEKNEDGFHGSCSFGLWQIQHETDDDFEFGFRRILNMKGVAL